MKLVEYGKKSDVRGHSTDSLIHKDHVGVVTDSLIHFVVTDSR